MSISLPFLRRYNYIEDYFYTLYELYSQEYVAAYPVAYYSIDTNETVWDNDQINAGSYEKFGVGELSGVKWKKINSFPVFGVEQMQLTQDSGEEGGLTYQNSMETQIVFPSVYGLIPLENDVVDLSFGYKHPAQKMKNLFVVGSINLAHQNDYYEIYQCRLKIAPFTKNEIENQISSDWTFYEHDRVIVPTENFNHLISLQQNFGNMFDEITSTYLDSQSSLYIEDLD